MAYKNNEDKKAYHRKWYAENKEKRYKQIKNYQSKRRKDFFDYKKTLSCEICGYNKCPEAIDFHHIESKEKEENIARMVWDCRPLSTIKEEIKKCKILCANCHREEHYNIKSNAAIV